MSYFLLKKPLFLTPALILALALTACDKGEETAAPEAVESVNATAPAQETPPPPPLAEEPVSESGAEEPVLEAGSEEPIAEAGPITGDHSLVSGNIKFNRFNIEIGVDAELDDYKSLSILHDGNPAVTAAETYRSVDVNESIDNYPLTNCETLSLEIFTGGANCCFGYYILSSCPDSDMAAYIEPIKGGMGAEPKNLGSIMGYPLTDPSFMYYAASLDSGESISLSGAESPQLVRYVVFDGDHWRLDKRGEFPGAYRQLAAEADGLQADVPVPNPVARAIYMSYYSYMAGDDPVAVKALLKTQLPDQYAHLSDLVFSDIEKAVAEYKPIQPVNLAGTETDK